MLCFAGMIIPTTLMGGTLPVLIKYFARIKEKVGFDESTDARLSKDKALPENVRLAARLSQSQRKTTQASIEALQLAQ
jgi:uncharacterized protein (DUF2461 family)